MVKKMNNKHRGAQFEKEFCKLLSAHGWWVHFITPAPNGGQPFDIIAVKAGIPMAVDCKTSVDHIFRISRLEQNQLCAFDKWAECGNGDPNIAVKYNDNIYLISYRRLKEYGRIDLDKEAPYQA